MSEPRFRFGAKRFVIEALSVTAGVLLAFSVDAWWARVEQRREVDGLSAAARVEAQANRATLERYRAFGQSSLAAAKQLTDLIEPDPAAVPPDSVFALLGTLLTYGAAPVQLAATDRLLSSGEIEVLDDSDFHRRLLTFRAAASTYAADGQRFADVHEALITVFGRAAPGAALSAVRGVHGASDFPIDWDAVLSDPHLEGAVGNLAIWIDNLNFRVDQLLALADSAWTEAP